MEAFRQTLRPSVAHIINDSDNVNTTILYTAAVGEDLSTVTRVVINVDNEAGTVLDSSVLGDSVIWWDQTVTDDDGNEVDAIRCVGAGLGLVAGVYRDCRIRLFYADSDDGTVWGEPLTLVVE